MTPALRRCRQIAAAAFALCVLAAGCGGGAAPGRVEDEPAAPDLAGALIDGGRLVVATSLRSRPFAFRRNGAPAGFDIDLMAEIARRLDLEPKFVDVARRTLLETVAGGEADAAISAIPITNARKAAVLFTDPTFAVTQALVTRSGADVATPADLGGQNVAVYDGANAAARATDAVPKTATVVEFPSAAAAFVALQSGQVAAVLADRAAAASQVEAGAGELMVAAQIETGRRYGIGLRRGNTALAAAVNAQLGAVVEDGTYAALYEKWFAIPAPEQFR